MGTIKPELVLFYVLLISAIILFLTLLYGLLRSPPGCKTEKNTGHRKPASPTS